MARKQKYEVDEVLKKLDKKSDLKIDKNMKVIQVVRGNNTCGNGTWGKIDFLVNYNGWKSMLVNEFETKKTNDKRRVQKAKN